MDRSGYDRFMSRYEYTLAFYLSDDCPQAVVDFFSQLDKGNAPEALPEADEQVLETPPAGVLQLLVGGTRMQGLQVTIVGSATDEEFYMPFIALAEWLARWSASSGPVGYYRQTALPHPTLLYFAAGAPYMLQATGTPVSISTGEELKG